MRKLIRLALGLAGLVALAAALPSLGLADQPVVHEHAHFTSDPYDDNWCGIDGTSVDTVVGQYLEYASGASLLTLNVTTLFTATASGKSMEIRQTGARRASAPVDNGDGTYSVVFVSSGQSPAFKVPQGPPIVLDVGLVEFHATFDAATGDLIAFEVVREEGLRPPGCSLIVEALT